MKPLYILLLSASLLCSSCYRTETMVCSEPFFAMLLLKGFQQSEVGAVGVDSYVPNGRFDSLKSSTLVLPIEYEVGVPALTLPGADSSDYVIRVTGIGTLYRLTGITKQAHHTETIKQGIFDKTQRLCKNGWLTYTLDGQTKPFLQQQYIEIYK